MSKAEAQTIIYSGPGTKKPVPKGAILGCGNPLLDICAVVPQEFFDKYEVKPGTAILAEEKHQALFEDMVSNFEVKYIAGGATQNSIRTAQWFLQSPDATSFLGAVGKDKFAATLKEACKESGVAAHYYETDEAGTGACGVLVESSGERALVTTLDAANCYKHAHTQSEPIQALIAQAKIFYISSFFSTVPEGPQTMKSIADHAVEHNKVFCINLSAEFLIEFFWDKMKAILPFADFVFGNETEAACFAKKQGWTCSVAETALRLSAFQKESGSRCRTVVFTQGGDSTVVARDGRVVEYPVKKLPSSLLVDTNGAGDAFVGGFLAGLATESSIDECVRAGHYAARVVIQNSGCVFPAEPDM